MALTLPAGVGDRLTTLGFRLAWRVVRTLPAPIAYGAVERIADLVHRRGGSDVQRLRANYARVRPECDPAQLDELVRLGIRSYLRYWCDAFRLPVLTQTQRVEAVRTIGDAPVRAQLAAGRGVVMFLGHLGNWDLAGAWSTTQLAPVTTVAERLEPEELFDEFVAFREGLGMTVLPLTGGDPPFGALLRALRAGGFVPLLADRDLTDTGAVVQLCGQRAKVATGPAALALATGAALYPVSITYRSRTGPGGTGSGYDLQIRWHDEVTVPDEAGRDRRAAIQAMTQQCVDALAETIVEQTQDWHMMQRVFLDDAAVR